VLRLVLHRLALAHYGIVSATSGHLFNVARVPVVVEQTDSLAGAPGLIIRFTRDDFAANCCI
jgi:hypothetical protein